MHPSVARIKRVAQALGAIADDVVFIGGAVAPLLQTDPPFDVPRPTKDVDAIVGSTSYAEVGRLHDQLRALGFTQKPDRTNHIHRWWSRAGDALDLVPCGEHLGGTGQEWDQEAITSSTKADLGDGVVVRIASAPVFLALKWAAHHDRGVGDPFASHDLEDILALIAARRSVPDELEAASPRVREYVASQTRSLLEDDRFEDLLAANLNNAQDPAHAITIVRERLRLIAGRA